MTTEPVRVAVIDSGVNPAHPHIGAVSGGIAIAAGGLRRARPRRKATSTGSGMAPRSRPPSASAHPERICWP